MGRELIGQPTQLWERFVGILAHRPAFEAVALEALALLLLERGSVAPKSGSGSSLPGGTAYKVTGCVRSQMPSRGPASRRRSRRRR